MSTWGCSSIVYYVPGIYTVFVIFRWVFCFLFSVSTGFFVFVSPIFFPIYEGLVCLVWVEYAIILISYFVPLKYASCSKNPEMLC